MLTISVVSGTTVLCAQCSCLLHASNLILFLSLLLVHQPSFYPSNECISSSAFGTGWSPGLNARLHVFKRPAYHVLVVQISFLREILPDHSFFFFFFPITSLCFTSLIAPITAGHHTLVYFLLCLFLESNNHKVSSTRASNLSFWFIATFRVGSCSWHIVGANKYL